MLTQSHIKSFGSYTVSQLEQMKKDLSFQMSIPRLSYCSAYYRAYEKRDPFIEEIKMLECFSEETEPSPTSAAPIELLTNCDFIAQTYADVMKKRHILHPDAKTPCTLAEMLTLAGTYLGRAGKETSIPNAILALEDCRNARLSHYTDNFIGTAESDFGARIVLRPKKKLETGDLLVILRLNPNIPPAKYRTLLGKLFNTPDITYPIKTIRTVSRRGLLYEILSVTDAAYLDLCRLSVTGDDVPLTMLATAYEGDCIVRISPKEYEKFAKSAYEIGIKASAFASVSQGSRIVFAEGTRQLFSLESSFLRTLFPARAAKIKIDGEEAAIPTPISHEVGKASACAYLPHTKSNAQLLSYQNHLASVAYCSPDQGFFLNAMETLLTPVLTLSAAGCDYADQRIAVGLTIPQKTSDAKLLGETTATILAIYRLQAELGLQMNTCMTITDPSINHPRLTALSVASASSLSEKMTAVGNTLYCISPKRQKNGLPDFAALRNLLDYLTKLRKRGVLCSARILCRETVTEGVQKMTSDTIYCKLNGHVVVADGALDLAILIESSEKLALTEVGIVAERKAKPSNTEEYALSDTTLLLPQEKAEITVLANQNDISAQILAKHCETEGAIVWLCTTNDTPTLPRAILESQTLIVCTDEQLPHTPQVAFAMDTFRRGGGRILLVGKGRLQKDLGGIMLNNGISAKILSQICKIKID